MSKSARDSNDEAPVPRGGPLSKGGTHEYVQPDRPCAHIPNPPHSLYRLFMHLPVCTYPRPATLLALGLPPPPCISHYRRISCKCPTLPFVTPIVTLTAAWSAEKPRHAQTQLGLLLQWYLDYPCGYLLNFVPLCLCFFVCLFTDSGSRRSVALLREEPTLP